MRSWIPFLLVGLLTIGSLHAADPDGADQVSSDKKTGSSGADTDLLVRTTDRELSQDAELEVFDDREDPMALIEQESGLRFYSRRGTIDRLLDSADPETNPRSSEPAFEYSPYLRPRIVNPRHVTIRYEDGSTLDFSFGAWSPPDEARRPQVGAELPGREFFRDFGYVPPPPRIQTTVIRCPSACSNPCGSTP